MSPHKPWKDTSVGEPKYVTEDVGNDRLNFYPLSLALGFSLKGIARPLLQAFSVLLGGRLQQDQTGYEDETVTDEREGIVTHRTKVEGADPKVLQMREASRERALDQMIDAFSEEENRQRLLEIIMDSLRENFTPHHKRTAQEIEEFGRDVDVVLFRQLLIGVAKANAGILGPFAERAIALAQKGVESAVANLDKPRDSTTPASGETSKTPSSSASPSESETGTPSAPST